jgi:hypothetical protein
MLNINIDDGLLARSPLRVFTAVTTTTLAQNGPFPSLRKAPKALVHRPLSRRTDRV